MKVKKVLALVEGSVGHTFAGGHPHHYPEKAGEYVDVILEFLRRV